MFYVEQAALTHSDGEDGLLSIIILDLPPSQRLTSHIPAACPQFGLDKRRYLIKGVGKGEKVQITNFFQITKLGSAQRVESRGGEGRRPSRFRVTCFTVRRAMRATARPFFSLLVFFLCFAPAHPLRARSVGERRLSDRYSPKAVKSYEVFAISVAHHAIAMVKLHGGEGFPMLCRQTRAGIYAIPQAVFRGSGIETWTMIAEPHVGNAYGLMSLKLSKANGNLYAEGHKLKRLADPPALLKAPAHPLR